MEVSLILRQILVGLSISSTYGLMAIGLALIFGMLGILNFAHYAFWSLSAYVALNVLNLTGLPFWAAVIAGIAFSAAVGVLVERFLFSRLYGQDPITTLILAFGLALIMVEIIRITQGVGYQPFAIPGRLNASIELFGFDFPAYRLFLIVLSGLVFYGIWALLNKTSLGLQIRAGIQDRDMVRALGINLNRLFTVTFAVGTGLAALGGVLTAPLTGANPEMGVDTLIIGFAVMVIGGMGSLKGTIIASYIVGLLVGFMPLISTDLSEIVIFIFMGIFIVVKPGGLFGEVTRYER